MKKLLVGCLMISLLFLLAASVNFYLNSSLIGAYRNFMSALLLLDCLIYVLLLALRSSRKKWIKLFWMGLVIGNIVLTLFDDLGIADFLFMAINLLILVLYFILHQNEGNQGQQQV